ncbi:MAG: DUF58 domain-containing protein [Planctomycetes bacterium]|nr:DUF58 domain-containing protein [Planctomycetota bacterium]
MAKEKTLPAVKTAKGTEDRSPVFYLSPEWLARVKSLEFRARLVVEGFLVGLHRSPYKGFSVEFSEHRSYVPGDDPRRIDWKVYGRTRRLFVKEYRAETNLDAYFLMDSSLSMNYGTPVSKAEYGGTCAAALALLLYLQGDRTGMVAVEEGGKEGSFLRARGRRQDLAHLYREISRLPGRPGAAVDALLMRSADILKKRGLVTVVSDFLAPLDEIRRGLGRLRHRGHDIILLWVLSEEEHTFPFSQPAVFVEPETGRRIITEPDAVRASYLAALEEHRRGLQDIARDMETDLVELRTDRNYAIALDDFLQRRGSGKV